MKKILLAVLVSLGLQTQAQMYVCDSLSYSIVIDSTTWNTLAVTGNADGVINMVDSIDWNFTACNTVACYGSQGNDPYSFPLIYPQDTVKLCYDAFVYQDSTVTVCNHCDSLVYDFNSDTWVVMNTVNPTCFDVLIKNEGMYNLVFDLQGRVLIGIQLGKMYIQNRKMYIKNGIVYIK
jgi:hypothetical protein